MRFQTTLDALWNQLKDTCGKLNELHANKLKLYFNEDRKKQFEYEFNKAYEIIKSQYMSQDTTDLDRHKQAAIFILSILKSGVLSQESEDGFISLGLYAALLDVVLSYLYEELCKELRRVGIKRPPSFELPIALTCPTSYFVVLCRLLYYEDPSRTFPIEYPMSYNILDWSDRFFLLEYICILKNGHDPIALKEEKHLT